MKRIFLIAALALMVMSGIGAAGLISANSIVPIDNDYNSTINSIMHDTGMGEVRADELMCDQTCYVRVHYDSSISGEGSNVIAVYGVTDESTDNEKAAARDLVIKKFTIKKAYQLYDKAELRSARGDNYEKSLGPSYNKTRPLSPDPVAPDLDPREELPGYVEPKQL